MDVCLLKNEFNRDFRPLLAANYLLLPRGIKDVTTAFAHGQIHGVNKKEPLYLTNLYCLRRAWESDNLPGDL